MLLDGRKLLITGVLTDRSIAFFYYANWLMRHPLLFSIAWCPVWLMVWQAHRARRVLKQKSV